MSPYFTSAGFVHCARPASPRLLEGAQSEAAQIPHEFLREFCACPAGVSTAKSASEIEPGARRCDDGADGERAAMRMWPWMTGQVVLFLVTVEFGYRTLLWMTAT
jgi:hypothetical protein